MFLFALGPMFVTFNILFHCIWKSVENSHLFQLKLIPPSSPDMLQVSSTTV